MGLPYQRRSRRSFAWWQLLLIVVGIVLLFFSWQNLTNPAPSASVTPNVPSRLSRGDVLPTATNIPNVPIRQIIFPEAHVVALVVPALRNGGTWETRNLTTAVGNLQGTSWLDGPGQNIVLAGHVEDAQGRPGPFAQLFDAKKDDIFILRDGERQDIFKVVSVERAAPDDMHYVSQSGKRRATLITCSDWNFKAGAYDTRLIVTGEPLTK